MKYMFAPDVDKYNIRLFVKVLYKGFGDIEYWTKYKFIRQKDSLELNRFWGETVDWK